MTTAADVLAGDATWGVDLGDARSALRAWPAASVRCCVTSPPYYGLRDYGTAEWVGGDSECGHMVGGQVQDTKAPGAITTGQRPGVDASRCRKCGARRVDSQLGLEATPEAYVAGMVAVFREVRRVLADDGTLWLNIGDSYNNAGSSRNGEGLDGSRRGGATGADGECGYKKRDNRYTLKEFGVKHKDLIGIPWLLAFALRSDGWYLRSEVVWHKPNPMPESVTDRPTKAHESLFLLTKSERYFYDADAIAEKATHAINGMTRPVYGAPGDQIPNGKKDQTGRTNGGKDVPFNGFRNRRSVWTVPTQSYHGAHFAVMPPKLVEPCVLAGSARGDVVMDPFAGSGTTLAVAVDHGRRAVGVELNAKYLKLIAERLSGTTLSLC